MKYQQLTHRLRFNMGPGRPDVVSERPMNPRTRAFLDGEEGTTVEIPTGAIGVDVAMLLKTGAIAVLKSDPTPALPVRGEGAGGKGAGGSGKDSG